MEFLGYQTGCSRGFQSCKLFVLLISFLLFSAVFDSIAEAHVRQGFNNSNRSGIFGIDLGENLSSGIAASSASAPCSFGNEGEEQGEVESLMADSVKQSVKLHLKKRSMSRETEPKESITESAVRDLARIQTLHTRIAERKNQDMTSRLKKSNVEKMKLAEEAVSPAPSQESYADYFSGQLMATLESGVSLGSGEYFIDVFVGSPPKHFSLILDTGSDLNWIQCVPCYDCFEQNGPHYNPKDSISFRNVTCNDPRCQLVSSPDPPQPCKIETQSCPYFYWYGDSSNTTGDFALETFTINLTSSGKSEFRKVENVMFGCGHWNRGLFHGAAGLLGLGRGPLSFSSQLQSLYGHSFSYCLVDRNSDTSVSSKLIFGEDRDLLTHPKLNFTSLINGKENPVDTFYYLQIKSIYVGGDKLHIPEEIWNLSADGAGGTIIDSGTTLSYFSDPAYQIIKEAFMRKVKGYKLVDDFPILHPCYNVSSVDKLEFPEFGIQFADGAVWNFPVENYLIRIEQLDIVCLAMLGTPKSGLSIIGNYQQQNFHILYDTKNSRLGYAPMKCAEV
ncbi:aspartyl protease family protein 2-like [Cucurbita moschata]|uniref:Aspartyl protease family protein 2-like n=1 Tax=Cucurbita moschata TaxID=3662 RepID=A0A6J1F2F7_CUCMO|nr:aspartyl protease family protein 2-like [Cucurbita moschata]